MLYIKQIMSMFECDETLARDIVDRMNINFSEASAEEFEWQANYSFDRIQEEIV